MITINGRVPYFVAVDASYFFGSYLDYLKPKKAISILAVAA